jgi:hypothetical protein
MQDRSLAVNHQIKTCWIRAVQGLTPGRRRPVDDNQRSRLLALLPLNLTAETSIWMHGCENLAKGVAWCVTRQRTGFWALASDARRVGGACETTRSQNFWLIGSLRQKTRLKLCASASKASGMKWYDWSCWDREWCHAARNGMRLDQQHPNTSPPALARTKLAPPCARTRNRHDSAMCNLQLSFCRQMPERRQSSHKKHHEHRNKEVIGTQNLLCMAFHAHGTRCV